MADRAPGRRASALTLLLYLGAAVVVPVLHAEREVLWSQAVVEAEHTSSCPIIHSDTDCPSVSHAQLPIEAGPTSPLRPRELVLPTPPVDLPGGGPTLLLDRTRAPPLA